MSFHHILQLMMAYASFFPLYILSRSDPFSMPLIAMIVADYVDSGQEDRGCEQLPLLVCCKAAPLTSLLEYNRDAHATYTV